MATREADLGGGVEGGGEEEEEEEEQQQQVVYAGNRHKSRTLETEKGTTIVR